MHMGSVRWSAFRPRRWNRVVEDFGRYRTGMTRTAGVELVRDQQGWDAEPAARDTRQTVDDDARELAIYHALKATDEVAAALQAHLLEEHQADLERPAAQSTFTNSLSPLRQARERLRRRTSSCWSRQHRRI
jgi:hypothetical protein